MTSQSRTVTSVRSDWNGRDGVGSDAFRYGHLHPPHPQQPSAGHGGNRGSGAGGGGGDGGNGGADMGRLPHRFGAPPG